jgi:acyl-coenzyme A thioesterase PaaI-like protein
VDAHRRTRRLKTSEAGLARNIARILRGRREAREAIEARAGRSHGDLCFACGSANLLGLQLEAERRPDGTVRGRFVVKPDHQGPAGSAHPGVLSAGLLDAMALAADVTGSPTTVSVDIQGEVPVGALVTVSAHVERRSRGAVAASAEATLDGTHIASARAVYRV